MSDLPEPKTAAAGAMVSRLSRMLGVCAIFTVVTPVCADPRAVVELFTSQGCSSCPPADKVLGELAQDPTVIALSLPIDYWDYLGWKDTLADSRFSARQKAYSHARGDRGVYTPQAVVNGTTNVLGSDRAGIENAAKQTQNADGVMSVPVTMTQSGGQIKVSVAEAGGRSGEIWICAVSKSVPITISRGENRGQQITYHNVVRNVLKVGDWNGKAGSWSVPLENIARDGVDAAAVYVQDGNRDKPGPMLGAAFTSLNQATREFLGRDVRQAVIACRCSTVCPSSCNKNAPNKKGQLAPAEGLGIQFTAKSQTRS